MVSSASARDLAAWVLPTPGSPSSRIGCPIRTARNSAAASWSPAMYPVLSSAAISVATSGNRSPTSADTSLLTRCEFIWPTRPGTHHDNPGNRTGPSPLCPGTAGDRADRLPSADVLAPHLRVAGLELLHRRDAVLVVEQHDLHALGPQEVQVARERAGLAHHHPRDLEEQDRARAHLARGQRRVHGGVSVGGTAAGVAQRGDFPVRHRVAVLHSLIVARRDYLTARREHRADRDAARLEACPRLPQGKRHHVPVCWPQLITHGPIRYRPALSGGGMD